MEQFLRDIGISQTGDYTQDGSYEIPLQDSNEYSRVYSLLDKSDLVDEDIEKGSLSEKSNSIEYVGDNYTIRLEANFIENTYKIIVTEN